VTEKKSYRWTLLCEDQLQIRFFAKLGRNLFANEPEYIVPPHQGKRGAAWDRVLKQYPGLLQSKVRRYPGELTALVVVVDSDQEEVSARKRRFDEELQKVSMSPRTDSDRVAICIPKWNIETWIGWLASPSAGYDETRSYEEPVTKELVAKRISIQAVVAAWDNPLASSEKALPSIRDARSEFDRILRI
jgi:hypothetical protein